jgi:hypothetical protein
MDKRYRMNKWWLSIACLFACSLLFAQDDSSKPKKLDSFLLRQKGIIGQLAQSILADTAEPESKTLQRIDQIYQRYNGRVIRDIIIRTLPFGVPIGDTTKRINNMLTHLADDLHYKSRDYVIYNNLFFKKNDKFSSFLIADNERHLRDLVFIQDAKIIVTPVDRKRDSVDIVVLTKDILSLGGSIDMRGVKNTSVTLKEDNHLGWGDRLQLGVLHDADRKKSVGLSGEYIKRNIAGTFIDASVGYSGYSDALVSGRREETRTYVQLIKPLVHSYMFWTYAASFSLHKAMNMYLSDSAFKADFDYKYTVSDIWAGWNITAERIFKRNRNDRLRALLSARILNQQFVYKPDRFKQEYFYPYADLTATLGAISLYRQVFYRTQYIYGFGRNEDVPEGGETTVTAGWTKKNGIERPYVGVEYQRYFFNHTEHYFNFAVRLGSFLNKGSLQDASALGSIEYFSRLNEWGTKWKQRIFVTASYTQQFNTLLDGPLFAESQYGLPGFGNNNLPGERRVTAKVESVFFSPWTMLYFKIAPFLFTNATYFKQHNLDATVENKFYPSLGGGFRIRNESLTFGTIEARAHYFPDKSFMKDSWLFEFNTNLRFKYNKDFIKRPDFVEVN